jgi:D-alanyl-D-alanine carboxypeptidase/D-alanyl-D-alanine-endopeptidase (penicillin-binding protein 4)
MKSFASVLRNAGFISLLLSPFAVLCFAQSQPVPPAGTVGITSAAGVAGAAGTAGTGETRSYSAAGSQALVRVIEQQLAPLSGFKCNYSVAILSAKTGETIFQANGDQGVAPASNMKLLTTISSIATLGPDFQFTTTLARQGQDYIIIGDGDPGLGDPELVDPVTETFDQWAVALRKAGVTKICGKLIFDDSIFDRQLLHPNWPANQLGNWYAAPVSGLNLNDNCLDISVGFDNERKAQLIIVPAVADMKVEPVWLRSRSAMTQINAVWDAANELKVKISLGSRPAGPAYYTVKDPTLFFAGALRDRFSSYGITIAGPVEFRRVRLANGALPAGVQIVSQYKTPIWKAALRANRNSQNFFAECLFKRMGYGYSEKISAAPVGSWANGEAGMKAFLANQIKVSTANLNFDDGSGLSRNNRVSANTIAKLLYFVANQSWNQTFMDTLAVAGKSGTMSKRMRGTAGAGRVYAKTGYITGVSGLSGYVVNSQRQPEYIFSMLYNFSPTGKLWQVKSISDRICVELAETISAGEPATTTPCPPESDTDDVQEDTE